MSKKETNRAKKAKEFGQAIFLHVNIHSKLCMQIIPASLLRISTVSLIFSSNLQYYNCKIQCIAQMVRI